MAADSEEIAAELVATIEAAISHVGKMCDRFDTAITAIEKLHSEMFDRAEAHVDRLFNQLERAIESHVHKIN